MARRTAAQLYRDLTAAGTPPAAARILTAISLAETGGDIDALAASTSSGGTLGPAYGAWLVRTDRSATGTGTGRDITALAGSTRRQADAARAISRDGTDYTAWQAWRDGTYQQYLGQVDEAVGVTPAGLPTQREILSGTRELALQVIAIGAGVALVAAGLITGTSTGKKIMKTAKATAKTIATRGLA